MINGISVQPRYDRVAALFFHTADDHLKVSDRFGLEDVANQLIHDDPVDFFAFNSAWTHIVQSVRRKLFRIDFTVNEPTCSGQADAPEPACDSMCGDDLGNVQPGQR